MGVAASIPDLPDVQVFREHLEGTSLRQCVEHMYSSADDLRTGVSRSTVCRRFTGATV